MSEPGTPLEWARWSRRQTAELRLRGAEARVLQILGGHSCRAGRCGLLVETIRDEAGYDDDSTVYRALSRLQARGLVRSRQRGGGRCAERQLVAVDPARAMGQLSLFDAPVTEPARATPAPPATVAPTAGATVSPCTGAGQPLHGRDPEGPLEGKTERALPREHPRTHGEPVLSPALAEVLEVLAEVDELVAVDPAAVDKALRAFPDARHLDAARAVVIDSLSGWRMPAARTLFGKLERAAERDRRAERVHHGARPDRGRPARAGRVACDWRTPEEQQQARSAMARLADAVMDRANAGSGVAA